MSFEFKIQNEDDAGTVLELIGEIDELADFSQVELPEAKSLTIDLSGIRLLNSVGLRSWVFWVRNLKQSIVTLRGCPTVVVHQINVLDGFMPIDSIVESFQVPYHCDSCGKDTLFTAKRGEHYFERTADATAWSKFEEQIECEHCGKEASMDVIPAKYFHFLRAKK